MSNLNDLLRKAGLGGIAASREVDHYSLEDLMRMVKSERPPVYGLREVYEEDRQRKGKRF